MMSIATFMCIYCKFVMQFSYFLGSIKLTRISNDTFMCFISLAPNDTLNQAENTIYLLNFALDAQDCGNYH